MKKTLKADLAEAAAKPRRYETEHAYGMPSWELDRQIRELPKNIAERAFAFASGEREVPGFEQLCGLDIGACAVLSAAENGGDFESMPQWIAEEWERRQEFERSCNVFGWSEEKWEQWEEFGRGLLADALKHYQELEAAER